MPITTSAKKALRGSIKKKKTNDSRKKNMRDMIKKVEKISKTDKVKASAELAAAYKAIDKAAKRGVIKKNTASRRKSRMARLVK
jgi:small subunit ribosomal protein S20